jgi:hypothetical protein
MNISEHTDNFVQEINPQNEFLLAEIDWLEEELSNCERERSIDKTEIGCLRHFNEDLKSRNLSVTCYNSILEVRLHKSDEVNHELSKENKKLSDDYLELLNRTNKTKWYHLLFNIDPK